MALTRGKALVKGQKGSLTQVLIAEQDTWASEAATDASQPLVVDSSGGTSGGDFYELQPRITTADIAREGTTIAQTEFSPSSAQLKDAAGPYDVANNINISVSGNGTGLIFRNLTQTRDPDWNILGASGKTIPAAVNIVANTELLKATSTDAAINDDLSSTNNPVQITATPSATATISGSRAIIYIRGTDHMDREIDDDLVFPASAPTAAQTTKLWYKTVTQVSSSGWEEASGKTFGVTARDMAAAVRFIPQD